MSIFSPAIRVAGLGLLLAAAPAFAQDAAPKAHMPLAKTIGTPHADRPIPSLAVINAASAKLDGGKLVLTGVAPNTIVFSDRPWRAAGHEMTRQFILQWAEGNDSFAKDPPNATVSALSDTPGQVADAVVELRAPKLDGTTLTFDVTVLEGTSITGGPVAVFIDWFAARGAYGGGVAHFGGVGGTTIAREGGGYWHAPVYHGAWYGRPAYGYGAGAGAAAAGLAVGAMAGAAMAAPHYYAPPACGYYPYPPCY